jgi:hypothetical protein
VNRMPIMLLLLAIPLMAFAEDDGNELLDFMQRPASHDVALALSTTSDWSGTARCSASPGMIARRRPSTR